MKGRLVKVIYWGAIAIALLGLASRLCPVIKDFFDTEFQAIAYPYSIDYGEGPLLDQTLRLAKFQNIYASALDQPPYTISNYPPLFPLIQVPFAWAFGPAFWYGRLINLICVLLAALFITLTLRALTGEWIGSVVGGLLLVASPYVQHWAKFNRIDELALALSWAGLFVVVRYVGQGSPMLLDSSATPGSRLVALIRKGLAHRPFWLGVMLIIGAILTRQTYALAAPAALTLWLALGAKGAWRRRFLQAATFAVVVGGVSLLIFLVLNLLTAGGFYLNIVVANVNAFDWNTVWNYGKEIRDNLGPLLGLTGGFILLGAIGKPARTRSAWALVAPYVLAATAGSLTIGKDGSNVNYLLEFSAALCVAAGAALAWASQWKKWPVRLALQLGFIALLAYQCVALTNWNSDLSVSYLRDQMQYRYNTARLAQMIKDSRGIVLADEFMGLVPLAGKSLYFQPFEYKAMSDAGVWDQTPFLQDIAGHKFDLILWYRSNAWRSVEGRWTVAQRNEIEQYYVEDQQIGEVHVMAPRK